MEEGYTIAQWLFYNRYNLTNALLFLLVLASFLNLIRNIIRDNVEYEYFKRCKYGNNSSEWRSNDYISYSIKDCGNCRESHCRSKCNGGGYTDNV